MYYKEFLDYATGNIKNYLPKDYADATVTLETVRKNNGIELDALLIRKVEEIATPSIYLNGFYDPTNAGSQDWLSNTMKEIANTRVDYEKMPFHQEDLDYSTFKDRIVAKLVSYDKNIDMLADMPFKRLNNLALIYQVPFPTGSNGMANATVTNSLMQIAGITSSDLDKALINTQAERPYTFMSMGDVISNMIDEVPEMEDIAEPIYEPGMMYVLTNQQKINGAVTMMYPGVLNNIKKTLGTDFYVLPSSIHETIIVQKSPELNVDMLEQMVSEVNREALSEDEILSDTVYEYDGKSLYLAADHSLVFTPEAKEAAPEMQTDIFKKMYPNLERDVELDSGYEM